MLPAWERTLRGSDVAYWPGVIVIEMQKDMPERRSLSDRLCRRLYLQSITSSIYYKGCVCKSHLP